jgi:hypothetical protein
MGVEFQVIEPNKELEDLLRFHDLLRDDVLKGMLIPNGRPAAGVRPDEAQEGRENAALAEEEA